MIFSCDRCGRRYSVPDERVQGRAFRVTCKACANVIVVRPAAAPQVAPRAAPQPDVAAPTAPPPRPAPAPAPPRAAMPPPFAAVIAAPAPAASFASDSDSAVAVAEAPRPRAEPDDRRGLTSAEMAWMSDRPEPPAAAAPTPEAGADLGLPDADVDEPEPRRTSGPSVPRLVLAAVILGVSAAGAVAMFWPSLRPAEESAKPPPVAAVQPPPPRPPPPPPPVQPEPPPPAPTVPQKAVQPATAVEPAKTSSRASFEPGTVTIARARKKEAHTLSKKDRKLLDLLGRKKDGAAPPEAVEALDLDSARSLDPAAVERVVGESQGAFSGCISRQGRVGNRQRATLLLTVDASGAVAAAWVAEAEVSKSPLGRCLVTAGKRLVFPAFTGEPVDVSVPLLLEAR